MNKSKQYGWNYLRIMLVVGTLCYFAAGTTTYADSVTFNFSGVAENAPIGNATTPGSITYYMDQTLQAAGCTGCTVTVVGAAADKYWDGDGHVVGPSGHPLTLGTYGGAASAISNTATPTGVLGSSNNYVSGTVGTFLADTNDSGTQVGVGSHNEMYIKFNGFTISGAVSFDYEIFPCATGYEGCTNPPGFSLEAGNGTSGSDPLVTSFGTAGTAYGTTPSGMHSAVSSNETSSQLVGYYSTNSALNGDSEIDFLDWPATIAVDNLTVSWNTPETSSMLLLATGLLALMGVTLLRSRLLA